MSKSTSSNASTKARILTLRQQLQQLKLLRESGSLSQPAYEQAAVPLERQLVDLVLAHPDAAAAASSTSGVDAAAAAPARPSKALVGSLLAGVLVLAAAGYAWTGSPGATRMAETTAPQQGAADGASADEQQFAAAVEKLAQRLKDQPDNAEGWAMLARS